jgi:glycosyltransferase involved in cell wall biosynthesis
MALRIAWIGGVPGLRETGGVPGVATDLLDGLAALGHRIDCFIPGSGRELPARLLEQERITFVWGTARWHRDRWYNRGRIVTALNVMLSRGAASLRLRREVLRRHRADPYDVIYQFSSIESLSAPARLRREVPLVVHPETHAAGELRWLLRERRLALRCQAPHEYALALLVMTVRTLIQRVRIGRADLLICISSAFRDHLLRDYHFPPERTAVIPNPVRLERFAPREGPCGKPSTVLILGRIAARKGLDDVVAVAGLLRDMQAETRLRIVGGPGSWSDYTALLQQLPQGAQYAGRIDAAQVPVELARSDLLLQASRYEPFGLTVAEALACGVPVVATSEVGAVEGVDPSVAAVVNPGDPQALADAVLDMLARLETSCDALRATARAEAQRLFDPASVCARISVACEGLIEHPGSGS